jgi:hypothetical protein
LVQKRGALLVVFSCLKTFLNFEIHFGVRPLVVSDSSADRRLN